MKFSTLQPYLPLSILISSGPSLLSENPRSLWSYCIEDAPTSNRIPSTDPGEIPCFFRIPGSSENCPIHGSSCWGLNRGKMENTFKAIYGKSICFGLSLFLNKLYISYLWRKFMFNSWGKCFVMFQFFAFTLKRPIFKYEIGCKKKSLTCVYHFFLCRKLSSSVLKYSFTHKILQVPQHWCKQEGLCQDRLLELQDFLPKWPLCDLQLQRSCL